MHVLAPKFGLIINKSELSSAWIGVTAIAQIACPCEVVRFQP
ncbi:protein of unknown function [Pseudorhizobium banfieldiae]|uniref:Uncharacterized protein n=1 Tax=Pseudorhizobium banfieldiae TaxID=1125847 RepID=L0NLA4_9HYPH|nr:protein of unknown function [Pseudorhizobium banfieldiae]